MGQRGEAESMKRLYEQSTRDAHAFLYVVVVSTRPIGSNAVPLLEDDDEPRRDLEKGLSQLVPSGATA